MLFVIIAFEGDFGADLAIILIALIAFVDFLAVRCVVSVGKSWLSVKKER